MKKNQEHWYSKDGDPRYSAGMKDVRAEGLLPSVTTVDKMIYNFGLEIYKAKQLKLAMRECPLETWEGSPDEWEKEIDRIAGHHSKKAAQRGTIVHKMLERYLLGKPVFYTGNRQDIITAFNAGRRWIDENVSRVLAVEAVIVSDRYAGKADLIARLTDGTEAVIDWKTTDPEGKLRVDGKTPLKGRLFMDSHCRQLAALTAENEYIPINVILSTNPAIPSFWSHPWTWEEREKGYQEFLCSLDLFYSIRNLEEVAA